MITNVQYILGLNFLSDTVVKKHLLNGQLSRKVVQLIYVGLIFKFQMIPPWIFHLGGGEFPPQQDHCARVINIQEVTNAHITSM